MKKPFRLPASAINELSPDQFIRACVAFQQAKSALSQHLNGADAAACDTVSRAVYDLANKAVSHNMRNHSKTILAVKSGKRLPLYQAIAKAVQGKKTFNSQTVIDAMKRRGTLPRAEKLKEYLTSTMSAHPELFKRVERGVYQLKISRKLVFEKKPPKELPGKTE
jgi:hypothetical protein